MKIPQLWRVFMVTHRFSQWALLCGVFFGICAASIVAEEPLSAPRKDWPQKVVVTVGEIRTRIDGPKLWTLSGIDYQDRMVATEDSAYGTVLTIRNVGHLGTAHFLDVPGKPGEIEKENVTHFRMSVDDQPVKGFRPEMNLAGRSFLMERKSKIRALDLETTVSIRDGVLVETARFRATGPIDLRVAYPWMYAWTPQATSYVFGDAKGIQKRGEFIKEGKAASQVIKNADWMAVFNPTTGKGNVCVFLKSPLGTDSSFLLVDAPGSYRKIAAYTLEDKIVPKDFQGTYQSAVGFFTATAFDWEDHAQKRAAEIRASQIGK